jgi:hypothetical protein
VTDRAAEDTGEARSGLHPVVTALRGETRPAGNRISHEHLTQRDRALSAIARAADEVTRLEQVERGANADLSPRLAKVREVKGELVHLRSRLDNAYV